MSTAHPKGSRGVGTGARIVSGHTIFLRTHPTVTTTSPDSGADNHHPITITHPGGITDKSFSAVIPPSAVLDSHVGNTPVVFVAGWAKDNSSYASFADFMRKYLASHLPKNTPILVTDWRQNVGEQIKKAFPGQKVVGVGFSFGGAKTTATVNANPNLFKSVVLLDPVDPSHADKPNLNGMALSSAVKIPVFGFTRDTSNIFPFSTRVNGGSNVWWSIFPAGSTDGEIGHSHAVFNNWLLPLLGSLVV